MRDRRPRFSRSGAPKSSSASPISRTAPSAIMALRCASIRRATTCSCRGRTTGIPRRKNISTRASSQFTADRTRSSATSSQKQCLVCNRLATRRQVDIQFTDEQELLRDSLQRLLRDQYDFDTRRKIIATEEGWSRRHWAAFAELGLLAAPFPEDFGGLGAGPLASMIIMQEFGRNLVVEPFLETIVLAGGTIEQAGTRAQREEFLPEIAAGKATSALAWAEGRSRYDFNSVATVAERHGDEYVLSGSKTAVLDAPWADRLIVTARPAGRLRVRARVPTFLVDRQSANLHLQSFKTID